MSSRKKAENTVPFDPPPYCIFGVTESPQIPPTSPIQAPSLESSPQPALEPQQHSASTTQSASGAAEGLSVPPEAYQVPALYTYFAVKGASNFPLRLSAQASTIVLSNSHHRKYVCIAGRVILGGLAARNARDLPAYRQTYDQLLAFAQDASHQEVICAELAQIRLPEVFLGPLMAFSFSPLGAENRPRAVQYLFLLQDEVMLLLDDIFSGEELAYADPGSLALTLWDCLEKHVQQLLLRLQAT